MSDPIDTGGPAFPHLNPNFDGNWNKEPQRAGMSVRTWLTGTILGGMAASLAPENGNTPQDLADAAVELADAAIAALKGGQGA